MVATFETTYKKMKLHEVKEKKKEKNENENEKIWSINKKKNN